MSGRGGGNVKPKRPAAAASSAGFSSLFNFGVKRSKTAVEEDDLTLVDGNVS